MAINPETVLLEAVSTMLNKQLKDPNSALSKKMLSAFFAENPKTGSSPVDDAVAAVTQSVATPNTNSEDKETALQDELSHYKIPLKESVGTAALKAVGDTVGTIGNVLSAKNNILSNVLLNHADSSVAPAVQAKYGNIYAPGTQIAAGGHQIRGAVEKGIGDGINALAHDLAGDITRHGDSNRQVEMIVRRNTPGAVLTEVRKQRGFKE